MVNLSCRAALRKGRPLTMAQGRDLLAQLARTGLPATCPHGSPVILQMDEAMLSKSKVFMALDEKREKEYETKFQQVIGA